MNLLIEKNVPLPTRGRKPSTEYDDIVEQLRRMDINESFEVNKKEYQKIGICIKRMRHKYPDLKVEFTSSDVGNNKRRFWRIK